MKNRMIKKKTGYTIEISGVEVSANRPEPIVNALEVLPFKRRMDPQIAIATLIEGKHVLIVDFFSSGLIVLNALKDFVQNKYSDSSFKGQREYRSTFRELSQRILIVVFNHRLIVRKAPEIGWFKILYPELEEFLLPFPQVQGLNSSWQWYQKGITIPVLNQKIHPWYATYFPTRFEHLLLFDQWLMLYNGEQKMAIDIGIGSGILSFLLLKHGFKKVIGTDSNPNAIIGLNLALQGNSLESQIELVYADLFGAFYLKTELIVFNPPWLPASHDAEGIDKAIYYDDDLFPRFFTEAKKHLNSDGRVVLLFSNLAQITKLSINHPVELELANGGRFVKEALLKMKVGESSVKTKRSQHWRASEMVELWVLKMI